MTLTFSPADSASSILKDATSHNGTWTVRNIATGAHRTFRVKTQADDAKFAPGKRVLSVMAGSNNEDDYRGLGFIAADGVRPWKKTAASRANSALVEMFAAIAGLWSGGRGYITSDKLAGYEVAQSTTCRCCNRKLTNPESIETGIGPVCAGRA